MVNGKKARLFRIRAGDSIKDLNVVVPSVQETIIVRGVVRYADGAPATNTTVRFIPAKLPGIQGDALEDTDAKGRFSIKIFRGLQGELHGDFFASGERYENCRQVQSFIKQSGKTGTMIKTPPIKINPQRDLYNLVLTFPFRACNRKR